KRYHQQTPSRLRSTGNLWRHLRQLNLNLREYPFPLPPWHSGLADSTSAVLLRAEVPTTAARKANAQICTGHIDRRIERPGNTPDRRGQNRAPTPASAIDASPAAPTASRANDNTGSVSSPPPGGAARGRSPSPHRSRSTPRWATRRGEAQQQDAALHHDRGH